MMQLPFYSTINISTEGSAESIHHCLHLSELLGLLPERLILFTLLILKPITIGGKPLIRYAW